MRAFAFLAKFAELFFHKIFDLSVCMDEWSPRGLSMTGGIKIYQCLVIKR